LKKEGGGVVGQNNRGSSRQKTERRGSRGFFGGEKKNYNHRQKRKGIYRPNSDKKGKEKSNWGKPILN